MNISHKNYILLTVAVVAIVVFFIIYFLVVRLFAPANSTSAKEESSGQVVAGNQLQSDPLVTVVPKEVRGGRPQPLDTDPKEGAAQPAVILMEFGDYECAACASMAAIIDQLLAAYPDDLQHVWKDFPIPAQHPYAATAAEAARCAQDQDAFWEYHEALLQQQKTFILNPWASIADELNLDGTALINCLESGVKKQLVLQGYFIARTLELDRTPSYYINDQQILGSQTYEALKAIIDQEIADQKQQEQPGEGTTKSSL